MKQILKFPTLSNQNSAKRLLAIFCICIVGVMFGQDVVINRSIETSATVCNEFDVSISITANEISQPQEVVLIIDRSGSMDDGPFPEPIDHAKDAAIDFVNNLFLPENNPLGLNKVSIVSYSSSASLDHPLSGESDLSSIIAAINAISTGGGTNIEDGLVIADVELTANGTFNCGIARKIILLTDGVANLDNSGNFCNASQANTICQQNAIAAGIAAQTTTVNSIEYIQNIFTIGLFGAISGSMQSIAESTLMNIQNAGAFVTEQGADLTQIYAQILGQLVAAASSIPGQPLVTINVLPGFEIDPLSLIPSAGDVLIVGQVITWDIPELMDETVTLDYSIRAIDQAVCGDIQMGSSTMDYIDSNCNVVQLIFNNPQFCVPCPEVAIPTILRDGCTNFVDYSSSVAPGDCTPTSLDYDWEFYLDNSLIGTSTTLSGTFEYTGPPPFLGEFRAVFAFQGGYGTTGCDLPVISSEAIMDITLPLDMPISGGDQLECEQNPIQTLIATATVAAGQLIVWYDAPVGGNIIVPNWNNLGTITFYAEAVISGNPCPSLQRTPVTLTIQPAPNPPINTGDLIACLQDPNNPLDANDAVTVPTGTSIVWYDQAIGGNIVANPELNNLGTITYYAEAFDNASSCSSLSRVEVFLTIVDCGLAVIDEGVLIDPTGGCIAVGDILRITYTVTNIANTPISNIIISDPLLEAPNPVVVIDGPTGDVNNDLILDITETWIYTADYSITQGDIDAGVVTSQAFVEGTAHGILISDLSGITVNDDIATEVMLCQASDIAIINTHDQIPSCGNICIDLIDGDAVTHFYEVTNQGNVSLSLVSVTDPLFESPNPIVPIIFVNGDTDNDGELDIDETWMYTAIYMVTQNDVDIGNITNQGRVDAISPDQTTVTDLSHGSSVLLDGDTVININQPPIIDVEASDLTVECDGQGNANDLSMWLASIGTTGAASDTCSGVTWTNDFTSLSDDCGETGSATVIFTATDACGLTITTTATFTIEDTTAPVIDIEASDLTVECDGEGNLQELSDWLASLGGAVSSDACSNVSWSDDYSELTNDCGETGMAIVTFTATDDCGNTATSTATFTIVDTTAPFVTIEFDDAITINCEDEIPAIPELEFEDSCSSNIEVSFEETSTFEEGIEDYEIVRKWIVTDECGNEEIYIQTIFVLGCGVLGHTDFQIFNGISPNGDGLNDYFIISGIENYPDNEMKIYNRWGVLVFDINGYGGATGTEFVFTGISDGRMNINRGKELPAGTYFYILVRIDPDSGERLENSGYLYINR